MEILRFKVYICSFIVHWYVSHRAIVPGPQFPPVKDMIHGNHQEALWKHRVWSSVEPSRGPVVGTAGNALPSIREDSRNPGVSLEGSVGGRRHRWSHLQKSEVLASSWDRDDVGIGPGSVCSKRQAFWLGIKPKSGCGNTSGALKPFLLGISC